MVANCDDIQNPRFSKALPFAFIEHGAIHATNVLPSNQACPFITTTTNMSHVARFDDAFPVAAIVSTLSRQSIWSHFVNFLQMHKVGITRAKYWIELPLRAVLRADTKNRDICASTLAQRKLPVENRLVSGDFNLYSSKIKGMSIKVSKGEEFPVVALPGLGRRPAAAEQEKEAARFFAAAISATQRLVIWLIDLGRLSSALGSTR